METLIQMETLNHLLLVGAVAGISGEDPLSIGLGTSPSNTVNSLS